MEAYEHSEMAMNILLSSAYSILANVEAQKDPHFRALLETIKAFDIDEGLFMLAYSKRLEQIQKEG